MYHKNVVVYSRDSKSVWVWCIRGPAHEIVIHVHVNVLAYVDIGLPSSKCAACANADTHKSLRGLQTKTLATIQKSTQAAYVNMDVFIWFFVPYTARQAKEPYGNLDMGTCRLSSCNAEYVCRIEFRCWLIGAPLQAIKTGRVVSRHAPQAKCLVI